METIIKNSDAAADAIIDPYLTWAQAQRWYGVNIDNLYEKLEVMEKSERGRLSSAQCDCVCTPSPPERDPPALTSRYSKAKEVTV